MGLVSMLPLLRLDKSLMSLTQPTTSRAFAGPLDSSASLPTSLRYAC
jgi:hypothetical protein